MAINRNQFKRTEVSKVKDEARKAEKTMYRNSDNEYVNFAKVEDGKNVYRVLPSKTGRAYIPCKTTKLKVYQEIKGKDGVGTGKYEWKDKNIFTSDIHGNAAFGDKDLLATYINYVHELANEIEDKDEKSRFLNPITGYRKGKGGPWVWGIKPTLNYICYVLQGSDIYKLQLTSKQIKEMTDISIDLTEGDGLSTDVFSDPEEGYPLCINKQKDENNKTVMKVSAQQMTRQDKSLEDFFEKNRVPDAVLEKLLKLPTLEDLYENVYTKREFDWTLDALKEFDRQNEYNIFENDNFLAEVEELEAICPEYKGKQESSDDEEKEEKAPSRSAERDKDASDAGSSYPTPMKMRKFLNEYIENEYGDGYELPDNLKLDELKHWYDLAKAEEMLPFDE